MEEVKKILIGASEIIDVIGILILLFGFIKALIKYLKTEIKSLGKTSIASLQSIRCEIGIYILLALDFLIASDIILTISELSQTQLIELAAMVILRTTIGYFLGKEVTEIEEFRSLKE